jgi:sugar phosphate permease
VSLRYSEKLIMRFGPRRTLVPGITMVLIGLLMWARTPVDGNYLRDLLPIMPLIGLGFAVSGPSLVTLAMSGASREDAGLASGLINTNQQVGGAIGVAVASTIFITTKNDLLKSHHPPLEAVTTGFEHAFWALIALAVLGAILAFVMLRGTEAPAPEAQAETA